MKTTYAIFDSTVFNIAARIRSCDLITLAFNLFEYILVPQEVSIEVGKYTPKNHEIEVYRKMQSYLKQIRPDSRGLQLCTDYDPIIYGVVQSHKNIHLGEAEAIAQAQKRQVKFIFTDDKSCIKSLEGIYRQIDFGSTLFLMSMLDVQGYLPNYKETIYEYHKYKPIKNREDKEFFRSQYKKALHLYGLPDNKKKINEKTSLKKLGIL